jgi:hypothetical protein
MFYLSREFSLVGRNMQSRDSNFGDRTYTFFKVELSTKLLERKKKTKFPISCIRMIRSVHE